MIAPDKVVRKEHFSRHSADIYSMSSLPQHYEFSTQGFKVSLTLRENSMKAFIEFAAEKDVETPVLGINREKFKSDVCAWIESIIAEKLINTDILENAFQLLFKNGRASERKISQGTAPKPGIDGKLLLMVKPYSESFDGIYDFTNRYQKKYDSISINAIVARIYDPKPGVDGVDVFHNPIQHTPGIPVEVLLNDKLILKDDQTNSFKEILATENGYLQILSQNKLKNIYSLSLETVLRINGDIDHKVGSIIFENEIAINGDVKEGFVINALHDVKITGDVNHSNVVSREGSIYINGTVQDEDIADDGFLDYLKSGSVDQNTLSASQKIVSGSIRNATVFAGDLVEIRGSIVRSQVYSSSSVICEESIYASKISAACGVEAKYFGNQSGVTTIVEFLNPVEAGIEYVRKKNNLNRLAEKKVRLELFLGPFIKDNNSIRRLSSDHQAKIKAALLAIKNILLTISKETESLNELKTNSKNLKYSRLNAIKGCYENLIVKADESIYKIDKNRLESFSIQYDWENNEFTTCDLKPINCELIDK